MQMAVPEKTCYEINEEEASRSLYRSLLARTLRDLVKYRGSDKPKFRRIYDDAYEWVFEKEIRDCQDPDDRFMSFESVCGILGFDHERVRERIPLLTEDDLKDLRDVAG